MRLKTRIKKQRSGYVTIKIPKPDVPKGLFGKCKKCGQMVLSEEVRENGYICPKCGRGFNSEEIEVVKEKLYKEKEDTLCELKDKVDILESAIKAETDTYLDFNKKSNEWAEKVFDKREIRKSLEINLEKLLSIGFEKTEEYKTLEKRLKEAEEESSKLF